MSKSETVALYSSPRYMEVLQHVRLYLGEEHEQAIPERRFYFYKLLIERRSRRRREI
jgi:hypothetical protein